MSAARIVPSLALWVAFVASPPWPIVEGPGALAAAERAGPGARRFLGDEVVAILQGATAVEVYRIKPFAAEQPPRDAIAGYPVITRGKDQGQPFAARLAAILLDDRTYNFESAKACRFMPGVALRLAKGEDTVELLLCFQCDELRLIRRDARGKAVRDVAEDFDHARPALVTLARDAFPDDPEIQALKAHD